jgi:hypothetical protein
LAAACNEQEMIRTLHEPQPFRVGLLAPLQFSPKLIVGCQRCRIPSRVGRKPVVKQVEAAQLLDVELIGEVALQLGGREEMKVEARMVNRT